MTELTTDDYLSVLETGARLAQHGLIIYRFEPGERLPVIEWANATVFTRSKFTPEQLFARPSRFFSDPENSRLPERARAHAVHRDETPFDVQVRAADGTLYWIEAVAYPLAPASDGAFRCAVATHPIKRVKEYQALARLLASAVDHLPEGIVILKEDAKRPASPPVIYLNPGFTTLTGYTYDDFQNGSYPHILEHAASMLDRGTPLSELRVSRADGSEFWAAVRAHPIGSPADHALVMFADVSERRRHQEERSLLSEAVSSASDFVIVTDSGSRPSIVYVNQSFIDATGFSNAELIGEPYESIFSSQNPPALMDAMRETIERGGSNYREALVCRKDGSSFWVELVERPFETEYGRKLRLNISRDITLRRRSTTQLSLLFKAMEKSPSPVVIYEPQNDGTLTVAYENEAAGSAQSRHLLTLWESGDPALRELIDGGGEFTMTYTVVRTDGELAVASVTTDVIRNGARIEAILTQERLLQGNDLLAVLPTLSAGRTIAERVEALRVVLHAAFEAELTIEEHEYPEGTVRIDEAERVAKFHINGRGACIHWRRPLPAATLTALRLCIETAISF